MDATDVELAQRLAALDAAVKLCREYPTHRRLDETLAAARVFYHFMDGDLDTLLVPGPGLVDS